MGPRIERAAGGKAIVRLEGDVVMDTAARLHRRLRALCRRRDVRSVVIDFAGAGRLDSAGVATVSLGSRMLARAGKAFDLVHLGDHHQAAFELIPPLEPAAPPAEQEAPAGLFERIGGAVAAGAGRLVDVVDLVADSLREAALVLARRRRLPAGALLGHAAEMGAGALPIVGLLSLLLGMTLAFQASVQLEQFGASVYVADLVGLAMVREFGPLITAIILTGRTGAAIAAELGTMRVREEVDALRAMGIGPIRFLVVPRLAALTAVQPALTLLSMFIGAVGGMIIAVALMDLTPTIFWERLVHRVDLGDFGHGLGKSLVFAWIIGLVGCYRGLRTSGGPASVGHATTRTVVTSIFLVIVVDSLFAIASTVRLT
ncbi:MAG TPA: ABC transporter permease [Kofleriaceae bacterium]|nr:ABC transporter permease [Kofleriaceae bacterium]